ncbi:hypothetical protein SCALM49S_00744 [Streptomyces californicus]
MDTVSDNGGITIDLPPGNLTYAVDASADNGDVSVDVPRGDSARVVKARSDNGHVTVRSANASTRVFVLTWWENVPGKANRHGRGM